MVPSDGLAASVLGVRDGIMGDVLKPHVTFCHRDFLWLNTLGLKFCFDVGHSALAPVFWPGGPQITPGNARPGMPHATAPMWS